MSPEPGPEQNAAPPAVFVNAGLATASAAAGPQPPEQEDEDPS